MGGEGLSREGQEQNPEHPHSHFCRGRALPTMGHETVISAFFGGGAEREERERREHARVMCQPCPGAVSPGRAQVQRCVGMASAMRARPRGPPPRSAYWPPESWSPLFECLGECGHPDAPADRQQGGGKAKGAGLSLRPNLSPKPPGYEV